MDSNVLIDYMGNKLPLPSTSFVSALPVIISVVTRMEIVGWYKATQQQIQKLEAFTSNAFVHPLDELVIQRTILIRQQNKIKLPDAIIAATAIVNDLTLLTHNLDDYKDIADLRILDSWKLG